MIRLKHVIFTCIIAMVLFLAFIFTGCNTSKKIVDKTTVNKVLTDKSVKDSSITVSVDSNQVKASDSQKIKETVSSSVSSKVKDDTVIEFVAAGGTYNAATGDATGVKSVNTSRQMELLQNVIKDKDSEILRLKEELSASRDSVARYQEQNNVDERLFQQNDITDIQETKSDWYWWVVIGFIGGVALVIFLKKFPYTKPIMIWL